MYTEYYNLSKKPFENTPDPDFLFLSETHREVLASLIYGVNEGKGFVLITGDVGTGKTTLIHALLKGLDPGFPVLHIINPRYTFNEILQYLAQKLGLESKDKTAMELTEAMRGRLEALDQAGKRAVLIIDEAHHLSEESLEEIRLISNIETEKRKLIQIILAGQLELYKKIQKDSLRQLKQRIVLNRQLQPLNRKETLEYVVHRLEVSGRKTPLFDERALALIRKKSGGVPRIINQVCDNALVIGYAQGERTINSRIIREVVIDMEAGANFTERVLNFSRYRLKWSGLTAFLLLAGLCLFVMYFFHKDWDSSGKPPQSLQSSDHGTAEHASLRTNSADALITRSEDQSQSPHTAQQLMSKPADTVTMNNNAANPGEVRSVRPNEYFLRLIQKKYGTANDTVVDLVRMANQDIKNIHFIYPEQKITYPSIKRESLIVKDEQGSFYIHYASFYELKHAQQATQGLQTDNRSVFLIPAMQNDTPVYRIYLGMFRNYEEAEKTLEKLDLKYLPFLNRKSV